MNTKQNRPTAEWKEWERKRNSAKTQWVVAVLAFWITVAILAAVYFTKGRLDLILLSIALGTLFLGIWLKTRFQLHERKEPPRSDMK